MKRYFTGTLPIVGLAAALVLQAQQQQSAKPRIVEQPEDGSSMQSKKAADGLNERGDKVMGFDHEKTTHHFELTRDGGAISVVANKSSDTQSRNQIRMHLRHITSMFAEGNFRAPMLIHAQEPPGTDVMKRLRTEIKYTFRELDKGAAIMISSRNKAAVAAIHEFLRFQITEHHTGDRLQQ